MGVLKSILLIVYLCPFGSDAQFRIIGLLNVGDSKAQGSRLSVYQSNAQGRGFSADEGLKKFLIRPKNIIRVHVIDDAHHIPETEQPIRKAKPTFHQLKNVIANISSDDTALKKSLKSGKLLAFRVLFLWISIAFFA